MPLAFGRVSKTRRSCRTPSHNGCLLVATSTRLPTFLFVYLVHTAGLVRVFAPNTGPAPAETVPAAGTGAQEPVCTAGSPKKKPAGPQTTRLS